jgi:hypothetical protein
MKLKSFTKALLKTVSIILAIAVVSSAALIDYVISELKKNPDPFVSDIFAEYRNLKPNKPIKDQTKLVRIGGRSFMFPIAYIQDSLDRKVDHDGLNLLYVLPDYKSQFDFNSREDLESQRIQGFTAHMLIYSLKPKDEYYTPPPVHIILERRKQWGEMKQFKGKYDSLEIYSSPTETQHANPRIYKDLYIEKENGKATGMIECHKDEDGPVPGCSYFFDDKGLRYKIYFNKKNFLPKWREQKQSAIKFIDQFEIKSNQESVKE